MLRTAVQRSILCFATIAVAPQPLVSQAEADGTPADLVAAAEDAMRAEAPEDATILLWRAALAIDPRADDAVAIALRRSIDSSLARVDPRHPEFLVVREQVATSLVGCAQSYLRKRWYRTAADVAELAARWDRKAAETVLRYADKRVAKLGDAGGEVDGEDAVAVPAERDPARPQAPAMEQLRPFLDDGGWPVRDGVLSSPRLGAVPDGSSTRRYFCDTPTLEDVRIRCGIRLGPVPAAAALAIGILGYEDYFLVELRHVDDGASRSLNVLHVAPGTTEAPRLGERVTLFAGYPKNEFATLVVDVRGRELSCSVDGEPALTVTLPRPAHGGYGFFITGNSPKREPVEFRGLEFLPLPEPVDEAAADDGDVKARAAARRQEVLDALAAAEHRIEAGAPEAGVRALRELRVELGELGSDVLRTSVQERIEEICAEHDPCAKARDAAGLAAAEALAGLAAEHLGRGARFAALELYRLARFYDPDHAAAEREALEQELAAVLAARRGRPPEPEGEEDNTALVAAFRGGRHDWAPGEWAIGGVGAIAPKVAPGEAGLLLADPSLPEVGAASVQARTMTGQGVPGLVFGVRSTRDLWVLTVNHEGDESRVEVFRLVAGAWQTVVSRGVRFTPEARAGFMTLAVELDDRRVRCRVGTDDVFSFDIDRPLPGRFGLMSQALRSSPENAMIAFRNYANTFPAPERR